MKMLYAINHGKFSDKMRKEKTILIKDYFCFSLKIFKYCGNVDGEIQFLLELHDNKNIPVT